jgi:hypothetical protein
MIAFLDHCRFKYGQIFKVRTPTGTVTVTVLHIHKSTFEQYEKSGKRERTTTTRLNMFSVPLMHDTTFRTRARLPSALSCMLASGLP